MAYALITGATSGIGKETSKLLAQEGYSLIITGRRKERLDQIKEELSQLGATQVIPLAFDIRDHKEMKTLHSHNLRPRKRNSAEKVNTPKPDNSASSS